MVGGPAGAGKSYLLYHVVHFCRATGWLVLYVPTRELSENFTFIGRYAPPKTFFTIQLVGSFEDYENERAARTILKRFLIAEEEKLKDIIFDDRSKISLHDFIQSGLREQHYFETWKELYSLICSKRLK